MNSTTTLFKKDGAKIKMGILSLIFCSVFGIGTYSEAQSNKSALHGDLMVENAASSNVEELLHYYDKKIYFTKNAGQFEEQVLYKADFPLGKAVVTKQGMLIATYDPASMAARAEDGELIEQEVQNGLRWRPLTKGVKGHAWMMNFVNSSPNMQISSKQKHSDVYNYFSGSQSVTNVDNFGEIWYNNVYDKVDVRYYPSEEGTLEYDIVCKRGFDKNNIEISFDGIEKIKKLSNGHLVLKTSVGDVDFPAPIVYQKINGKQVSVGASYLITGNNKLKFNLENFDPTQALIIDPIALRWASWVNTNSTGDNHGHCIWVDPADGAIYVVARVVGSTNLITPGAFDETANGNLETIIGKYLEPTSIGGSGTRVWQTYIGGNGDDNPYAMEQGPDGNLYITGQTASTNFPLLGGSAFSGTSINQGSQTAVNIFVLKINKAGNSIKSAIIGGNGDDNSFDIRLGSNGNVYVCGGTSSTNLATLYPSTGAVNRANNNNGTDGIVFNISQDLSSILWMKNFGGTGSDRANIMLLNTSTNEIFLAGQTASSGFPVSSNARQNTLGGTQSGFIQKILSNGNTAWSTYFQSASTKSSSILCMEFNTTKDQIFFGGITGGLASSNVTSSSFDNTYNNGTNDFFVSKIDTNQTLVASTYLGGSLNEVNMMGLNTDQNNDVYIFGYSNSTNFPISALPNTPIQASNLGNNDKTFTKLSSSLSSVLFSTYYGGAEDDYDPVGERGIKFSNCRIYTIVTSRSNNLPLTQGALNTTKSSTSSIYEPGLVVWANPPDLLGNTITGNQTICAGSQPSSLSGSMPAYSLPTILRNGSTSAYPSLGNPATYQWQSSTDSVTWTNISGATSQNLSGASLGTLFTKTFVRRIIGGDACILAGAADQVVTVRITSASATQTNVTCFGSMDGSLTANSDGVAPFSYVWSNGETSQTISNLDIGTYTVTVTDAGGCIASNSFTITQPDLVNANAGADKQFLCAPSTIQLSGSTTSPNSTFGWTTANGNIVSGISSLTPQVNAIGTYVLTVTGPVNGCIGRDTVEVTLSSVPTSSTINAEICEGQSYTLADGSVKDATGQYITTILNTQGCDSTITTNLLVKAKSFATVNDEICEGGIYTLADGSTTSMGGQYIITILNAQGCDSIITTNLLVKAKTFATVNVEICDGETYTLVDGTVQSATGQYIATILNTQGCDSIVTTNLLVKAKTFATVNVEICDGETYTLVDGTVQSATGQYIATILNTQGCDSTVTTNLLVKAKTFATVNVEICDGETYTLVDGTVQSATGQYIATILNTQGCDSTVTTNLLVKAKTFATVNVEICDGETYTLVDGTIQSTTGQYIATILNTQGCDSTVTTNLLVKAKTFATVNVEICDGGSYTPPGGTPQTTTGQYITTILNEQGCDSTITTNLVVKNVTSSTQNVEICEDETYTLADGSVISTTGQYIVTVISSLGCDSIITTNLLVKAKTFATVNVEICDGETYTLVDGTIQSTSGQYIATILNTQGCDSIITTNLLVKAKTFATVNVEICDGETYTLVDGTIQSTSGQYIATILNTQGCDSIVTTNLLVKAKTFATVNVEICDGETYTLVDGSVKDATGQYIATILNTQGCDSTVTTNLLVKAKTFATVNVEICDGGSYTPPGGTPQTTTGQYITTILNAQGCDSTITTNLAVKNVTSSTQNIEICEDETYTLADGSVISTTGQYIVTVISSLGCDSIITTNLLVKAKTFATVNVEICDGETYTLVDGTIQSTSGQYIATILNTQGCDSTVTTNLLVKAKTFATVNVEICDGETYTLVDGTVQSTSGQYIATILNTQGCDSTVTTNLLVKAKTFATVNVEICDGETYTLVDGSVKDATGQYIATILNTQGCDSTVTTNLLVKAKTFATVNVEICDGGSYTPPGGTPQTTTGQYITTILNAQGCDSTITTNLVVKNVTSSTQNVEICEDETYTLADGSVKSTTGQYIVTVISSLGCDSIITTNLLVKAKTYASVNVEICEGESYTPPGGTPQSTQGQYITTIINAQGCDSIITTNLIVKAKSIEAVSINASATIINVGDIVTLSVVGGQLGDGANWKWYSGSCGGSYIGQGLSIQVTPNANTTYFVRAEGNCNTTACVQVTINVNSCSIIGIGSNAPKNTICAGTSVTLTVQGSIGAGTSWKWYKGGCCVGSVLSSSSTLTVAPTTTTTYFVRYQGGVCGTSNCLSITITVIKKPATPGAITGLTKGICNMQGVVYSVAPVANATTYNWLVPNGATIASGQGTNSIVVNYSNTLSAGSGCGSTPSICVTASNECGVSAARIATVSLIPAKPCPIAGKSSLCKKEIAMFSVLSVPGATSYLWTIPSGSVILSGQGTPTISLQIGNTGGTLTVKALNSCGTSAGSSLVLKVNSCAKIGDIEPNSNLISMWPNPVSTTLNLKANDFTPLSIEIYNMIGELVMNTSWNEELSIENLNQGMYIVKVISADQTYINRIEVVR